MCVLPLTVVSYFNSTNSYISKVDVLHILVTASYRRVPCLDQILEPTAVTRLRNQLLEAEYYQLAVEVMHGERSSSGVQPQGSFKTLLCFAQRLPSFREHTYWGV